MKKILQKLSFVVLLFASDMLYSQNNMDDVVYMKNGGIFRGTIIEQVPNQTIKVQTKDHNVFVLKIDEVEKMTKENPPTDNAAIAAKNNEFTRSGFTNLTEVNFCPGIGSVHFSSSSFKNEDCSFGFRTVNGYQLNGYFSFGVGIGIDKNEFTTMLPLTLDARVNMLRGKISPTINLNFGYSIGLYGFKGGFTINPSLGIKVYINKNFAYLFNVGYKLQLQGFGFDYYYPYYYPYNYYYYYYPSSTNNVSFQYISLTTGFTF